MEENSYIIYPLSYWKVLPDQFLLRGLRSVIQLSYKIYGEILLLSSRRD